MKARQFGSMVIHEKAGVDDRGNVLTKCGRTLTDPAHDVNAIRGARLCRKCATA